MNLTVEKFKQKRLSGEINIPVVRLGANSQKAGLGIHLKDLSDIDLSERGPRRSKINLWDDQHDSQIFSLNCTHENICYFYSTLTGAFGLLAMDDRHVKSQPNYLYLVCKYPSDAARHTLATRGRVI